MKSLLKDDGGSAIIVVLVTMTFVIVLASILLYTSLVNMQMKKLDKEGKANFYSAESVMNEVRAVVQATVSDAIKKAYTEVLANYSSYNSLTAEQKAAYLADKFREKFYLSQIAGSDLFDSSHTTYKPTVLFGFLSQQPGEFTLDDLSVKLENGDTSITVSGSQTVQDEGADILLKGIVVTYVSKGYQTKLSSDIRINMPKPPESSGTIQTTAPDFALITRGTLTVDTGAVTLTGNAGAGAVMLNGNGCSLKVVNAHSFIVGNKVDKISGVPFKPGVIRLNGGTLTTDMNSELWATNIVLDIGAKISIAGDARVANDLNLLGNETQAVLGSIVDGKPTGRYIGYGNTSVESTPAPSPSSTDDPSSNSSAILVNGRNTFLDMRGLRYLLLAGHSYVNYDTGTYGGYVMTGESVSVKSNQLAYLVPDTLFKKVEDLPTVTNPYQYTTDAEITKQLNAIDFTKVFLNGKSLSSYGIDGADNIQPIRKAVGATKLVYFCLKFPTIDDANNYFSDYYAAKKPEVQKYLALYTDGILLSSSATKTVAGDVFTFDGTQLGEILNPQDPVSTVSVQELADNYAKLITTLSTLDSDSNAASPFDYFVNENEINQTLINGDSRLYYSGSGTDAVPKVVVARGDYTISTTGTPDTVHVVIATGDVTVGRDFKGLIFAGANVYLDRPVTADSALTVDALNALRNGKVFYFLNPEHIAPPDNGSDSGGTGMGTNDSQPWDLNDLVTYQNWTKNEA